MEGWPFISALIAVVLLAIVALVLTYHSQRQSHSTASALNSLSTVLTERCDARTPSQLANLSLDQKTAKFYRAELMIHRGDAAQLKALSDVLAAENQAIKVAQVSNCKQFASVP